MMRLPSRRPTTWKTGFTTAFVMIVRAADGFSIFSIAAANLSSPIRSLSLTLSRIIVAWSFCAYGETTRLKAIVRTRRTSRAPTQTGLAARSENTARGLVKIPVMRWTRFMPRLLSVRRARPGRRGYG